jgi:Spy/CpxP family protein refolding chaperone
MKRVRSALSILVLSAQVALAADPPGPPPGGPPRGGPPIERLAKDLNLDDTQKTQVKGILDAQHEKHESARAQLRASGQRSDPETMHAQMQQDDQDLLQQLSGVLTPEQLTKFKQMQAQRREHMRNGPPPPPPGE